MIRKLPWWVEIGGFWLAAVAGAVNAVGLLGFRHQAVSHLTGTSSLLGVAVADRDAAGAAHLAMILAAFVLGAALSGAIVENVALRLGRRYSYALAVEAGLLSLAMLALREGSDVGHLLASAACGLQNGMVTTFSGAVVRTTHVSGLFTDLGVMLGAGLRGHPLDVRKLVLYSVLILGFVLGGVGGAVGYRCLEFTALAFPAAAALALAGVYWVYQRKAAAGPAG